VDAAARSARFARAIELAERVQRARPALFAEPALRFPLAAAHRAADDARSAERFYLGLHRSRGHDAWWSCAAAERWLAEPRGDPPLPVAHCASTAEPPRLDGVLDDGFWQAAEQLALNDESGEDDAWRATVCLARDGEYLYVAATCRRPPGATYDPPSFPRPRDPDLAAQDRVDLLLDTDRDRATYFHLIVDHRGWTGEACGGDRTWNPTWHVAAASDETAWTFEAALPLDELVPAPPATGDAWALGAQRIVPGVGLRAWSRPAAVEPRPEAFGLLLFE
jgi:hypothetical protein